MENKKISDNPGWKQTLSSQNGFIRSVFCLAFLAIIAYSAYQFGQPFYKYSTFKSEAKEILRISPGDTDRIRTQIYEAAEYIRIPVEEKDITVTKKIKRVRVTTSWSETVDIFGIYQKTLDFKLDIEE
ncbi:MAG: hypothetical protein AABY42_02035 [Nitrospirota bacterium]